MKGFLFVFYFKFIFGVPDVLLIKKKFFKINYKFFFISNLLL